MPGTTATSGTGISGATSMGPWAGTGRYLCINTNGFYYYASVACLAPATTKFKRKIKIIPITDVDGISDPLKQHIIKVTVQVSWDEKATILNSGVFADICGASNCITAEETLYDWYNYVNQ